MANIVLAHGFLGFGDNLLPLGPNYFNGVKAALQNAGHDVLAPMVEPLGSLDSRSAALAAAIERKWPDGSPVAVIAHSMGGLDARRVICRHEPVGRRIHTLITIATPHLGTPVADAILERAHPLHERLPPWMQRWLQPHAGALMDLHARQTLQDPDRPGVRYMEVVCVAPASLGLGGSYLFRAARAIGQLYGPNDGVVTAASARCGGREPIAQWPMDHGEAVGWPSSNLGISTLFAAVSAPAAHLQRYLSLAARL